MHRFAIFAAFVSALFCTAIAHPGPLYGRPQQVPGKVDQFQRRSHIHEMDVFRAGAAPGDQFAGVHHAAATR